MKSMSNVLKSQWVDSTDVRKSTA